jgi:hypothetical protein
LQNASFSTEKSEKKGRRERDDRAKRRGKKERKEGKRKNSIIFLFLACYGEDFGREVKRVVGRVKCILRHLIERVR